MEIQKTLSRLSNLEKENKTEGIRLTDFKLYYKTKLSKRCSSGTKSDIAQHSRIESPEINPHFYGQLIYDKGSKTILSGRKIASSINASGKSGQLYIKESI